MVECSFTNYVVVGSDPVAVTYTSDMAPVLSKDFLHIQVPMESRFTLNIVRDRIITYGQTHGRDKYSQCNFIHLARFANWLSVHFRTKWLWSPIPLLSLKLQIWHLF